MGKCFAHGGGKRCSRVDSATGGICTKAAQGKGGLCRGHSGGTPVGAPVTTRISPHTFQHYF